MRRRLVCSGVVLSLGALALGQHALDAYFGVNQSRVNTRREPVTMGRQIYRVDTATGGMRYDRAAAFNDPTYNIYARQRDPFEFGTRPVNRTIPDRRAVSPHRASMAQPSYRPSRQRVSPMSSDLRVGMSHSTYSPTRARATRISPTRVR